MSKFYNCTIEGIKCVNGKNLFILHCKDLKDDVTRPIEVDQPSELILDRMKEIVDGKRDKLYLTRGMRDIDVSYLGNNKWQLFDEFDIYEFEMNIFEMNKLEWKNLSDDAKNVIEFAVNPFTDKCEIINIEVGKHFVREKVPMYATKVDILITPELFKEIKDFITQDENFEYTLTENSLIFKDKLYDKSEEVEEQDYEEKDY